MTYFDWPGLREAMQQSDEGRFHITLDELRRRAPNGSSAPIERFASQIASDCGLILSVALGSNGTTFAWKKNSVSLYESDTDTH